MNSYVSLDLETTGLNPKLDKIIEIGAVKVVDGRTVDNFASFVSPGRQLEERITELTGITGEDLKDAPLPETIIPKLLEFIGDLPLVGHRILFDYSFVKHEAVNQKLSFDKEGVDTLKISRACHPELPGKRLTDMCSHYGISYTAHRALNDAEATAKLYELLKENFAIKYPQEFVPSKLIYNVKKESPVRPQQLEKLRAYLTRHNINCPYELERMSRNEAARYYDKLVAQYGR